MLGLDPRLVGLFGIVFIVMGVFSAYQGRKRLLAARAQGQAVVWYKQVNILTGIEYLLLAVVLLLSMGINYKWFSPALTSVLVPVYWMCLLVAALILCVVMYQSLTALRRPRTVQGTVAQQNEAQETETAKGLSPEERAEQARRRRERRQKAAEDRRRRAGKA